MSFVSLQPFLGGEEGVVIKTISGHDFPKYCILTADIQETDNFETWICMEWHSEKHSMWMEPTETSHTL